MSKILSPTPPHLFMVWYLAKHRDNLTFYVRATLVCHTTFNGSCSSNLIVIQLVIKKPCYRKKWFTKPCNRTLTDPDHIVTTYSLRSILIASSHPRGPFEKFEDSPYHSGSELCEGAVTVSFSKYLPWQAMYLLQRSTHFPKTCCRPLITSKFLASKLPFHGWKAQKSHGARSGLYGGCSNGAPPIHLFQAEHKSIQISSHATSGKRELRGKKFRSDQRSAARFREVNGAL
jgi:hypothetical protein